MIKSKLPKSVRTYIRREKKRIRATHAAKEDQLQAIHNLYRKFGMTYDQDKRSQNAS